jgi:hypothetical protein
VTRILGSNVVLLKIFRKFLHGAAKITCGSSHSRDALKGKDDHAKIPKFSMETKNKYAPYGGKNV